LLSLNNFFIRKWPKIANVNDKLDKQTAVTFEENYASLKEKSELLVTTWVAGCPP